MKQCGRQQGKLLRRSARKSAIRLPEPLCLCVKLASARQLIFMCMGVCRGVAVCKTRRVQYKPFAPAAAGLIGLWGYRKVGHLRASLFNAVPVAACERLADFMTSFAAKHRRHVHVGQARHAES